jgi:flagellar basal body rod protein FlgC
MYEDKARILELLLVGIEISVDNIINSNTTRISGSHFPYKYKYLIVFSDLSFSIGEKDEYKILYDPIHPDAITDGELAGYVLYPAINIEREYSDILEMAAYIKYLNGSAPNLLGSCREDDN